MARIVPFVDLVAQYQSIAEEIDRALGVASRRDLPIEIVDTGLRHLMAAASATPAETTLVGDSMIDWRTGKNAGVRVCLVRYGFGFEGVPVVQVGGESIVDAPDGLLRTL